MFSNYKKDKNVFYNRVFKHFLAKLGQSFLQLKLSRSSSVSMGSVASFDDLDNDNPESDEGQVEGSDEESSDSEEPKPPIR